MKPTYISNLLTGDGARYEAHPGQAELLAYFARQHPHCKQGQHDWGEWRDGKGLVPNYRHCKCCCEFDCVGFVRPGHPDYAAILKGQRE